MHRSFATCSGRVLSMPRGLLLGGAALAASASVSHAWLGSFEGPDGYAPFLNMVQNYNAGQHGASSGYGGSFAALPPNSGLWTAVSGGFATGSAISYATGHQFFDRSYVNNAVGPSSNQGLVITTGHEGWGGPACKYRYNVDSFDLGGVAPAATANHEVKLSFWTIGQLAGPEIGGQVVDGYFGNEIAFEDALGNVGFSVGLTQRAAGDRVTYWNGATMFESAIIGNQSRYDRWDITLNLLTDTVTASYFQFSTSTTTVVATNIPMMNPMGTLASLSFRSSDGTQNSKLWAVDDFAFTSTLVPTPSSGALVACLGLTALRRRRR